MEKRWGIIFKCLTTRCLHLDLLGSMDVDTFLLALRRFISRQGKPLEIWSKLEVGYTPDHRPV